MTAFLSPVFGAGAQLFSNQGIVLSGGKIWTYQSGTTTPLATWTDSTQAVSNANPIILDSAGRPSNEMWLQSGSTYKLILMDSNNNILGTWDNVAGLNDVSSSITVSEWTTTALTPSYISGTSFSVPGNNTSTFVLNRRVKLSVSAGTAYGYVVSSSFGGGITTVVILPDSTVIDSGVSAVSVGLLASTNVSVPQQYVAANAAVTVASAATTNIGAAGSANVTITGVVTITAFDNVVAGIIRFAKFTGILTLTHNGTSLILPGAANITTANGDEAVFRSLGSGNWECIGYQKIAVVPGNAVLAANATNATSAVNVTGSAVVTGAVQSGTNPKFNVVLSGNQSLTSGVSAKIAFNTRTFDVGSFFDIATNYRYQPTVAGYYRISFNVEAAAAGTSITLMQTFLYKNATPITQGTLYSGAAIQIFFSGASISVYMNGTTDYIELYANVTASVPVIAASQTYLCGELIP